jgi:SAM-dependent methyltransferase
MYLAQCPLTVIRGLLKRYGPESIKMRLWDMEYSGVHWDFADNTVGDCVYPHLERYVEDGNILDLGCGAGNTATELAPTYRTYIGVDISEVALAKARRRIERSGRADKNRFIKGDLLGFVPTEEFDVILFRESMYHVPLGKVKSMLDRYSQFLKDQGVFIVKMVITGAKDGKIRHRLKAMVDIMETEFDVVERAQYGAEGATVLVFRPRNPSLKD